MFINHTNHPAARWSAEQISAARVYGEIVDVAFPAVNAAATTQEVRELVQNNLKKILELEPAIVLCQGEFNYTFAMVEELKKLGVKVVAATSERVAVEEILSDGSTRQISTFRFVQFREY
ncbi:MAG: CRISPR-associated protein [Selenomonadaceae bacterium]|nr:CRISPR-associated protein [Selenomonadaceae bacterium]